VCLWKICSWKVDTPSPKKIKDKSILPVIKEIQIEPQDRGKFMGVGGSTIKNIERLTGYNFIDKIISF